MHLPGGINLIFILAVALLVFGPNRLPEIALAVGKAMREFKNATRDLTEHLDFTSMHSSSSETRVYPGSDRALAPAEGSAAYSGDSGQSTGAYGTNQADPADHYAAGHYDGGDGDFIHGTAATWGTGQESEPAADNSNEGHGDSSRANPSLLVG